MMGAPRSVLPGQRHIARNDFCQHTHGGADLRFTAFIREQASENRSADALFIFV